MTIDNAAKSLFISHTVEDLQFLHDIFSKIWELVSERPSGKAGENGRTKNSWDDDELIGDVISALKVEMMAGNLTWPRNNPLIARMIGIEDTIKMWVVNAFRAKDDLRERQAYFHTKTSGGELWNDLTDPTPESLSNEIALAKSVVARKESGENEEDALEVLSQLTGGATLNISLDDAAKVLHKVVPIDSDTGVEQPSTQWSHGQHQFVQLKHWARLTDLSLKVNFDSNIRYLRSPKKLFGCTGTLGSKQERSMLGSVYLVDFFKIPRNKTRRYEQAGTG